MVSAGTKRKRRERQNKVAAAIEDARAQAHQERLALGTAITPDAPDAALFSVDREKHAQKPSRPAAPGPTTAAERRAAKRARRAAPTQRRSEAAATVASTAGVERALLPPPRKNKASLLSTDEQILTRRPEYKNRLRADGDGDAEMDGADDRKAGDGSSSARKVGGRRAPVAAAATKFRAGREDVWAGDVAAAVRAEVTDSRRSMVKKLNGRLRRAPAVLVPDAGMSINPTYEQHQDKLGEELAEIVAKEDEDRIIEEKLSFDPKLLEESREGEVADTGMKDDAAADDDNASDDDEEEALPARPVPERKTRAQRNKEARKNVMATNIKRKAGEARRASELANLEAVDAAAATAADKLSGVAKKRERAARPRLPRRLDKPVMKRVAGQRVRNENVALRVALSEDLAANMRGVRLPVANPMLRDRFLSLERRGMVEPPSVIPKEMWRLNQEKAAAELKDRRKRKGRGANSDLTFWKNGKRAVK